MNFVSSLWCISLVCCVFSYLVMSLCLSSLQSLFRYGLCIDLFRYVVTSFFRSLVMYVFMYFSVSLVMWVFSSLAVSLFCSFASSVVRSSVRYFVRSFVMVWL